MAENLLTLSPELSARVRAKADEAGYASPESFLAKALDDLDDDASLAEPWMLEEAMEALDELDRNPSSGRTPEEVQATLDATFHELLARDKTHLPKAG